MRWVSVKKKYWQVFVLFWYIVAIVVVVIGIENNIVKKQIK